MALDPATRGVWATLAVAACLALGNVAGAAHSKAVTPAPLNPPDRALVDHYCVGCHNDRLKTAGVSLQSVDFARPAEHRDILERVLHKISSGEMPPAGRPRPDTDTMRAFAASLEGTLDRVAAEHPNPGRTGIHRLNRVEYSNAIRDLLALDVQAGAWLPVDDSGYGFDNIADVLSTSPALLERYMIAGRRVSRLAIGDMKVKPAVERFDVPRDAGPLHRTERVSDDLPFGSRGGLSFRYYFPLDADYVIRIATSAGAPAGGGSEPIELRLPVKAGLRTVGVTFRKDSLKPEAEAPATPPPTAAPGQQIDLRLDGARAKLFDAPGDAPLLDVAYVTIAGPYDPTGRGDTASRRRIFVCHPGAGKDETPCARTILTKLVHRAFRRPATPADVQPLMLFYQTGRREGDFDNAIEQAVQALLVSPEFLFRMEQDPRGSAPGGVHRLTNAEIASRLSFFLWSSIPDDQLLDLAERGKLTDPAVLEQQVRRLFDDPRSEALVTNFGGQWLYTRNITTVRPDPGLFRFDASLREGLQKETTLFFDSILREDRSIMDFLAADYTFVNERLAQHYGIRDVYGPQFRRVALADQNRRGLLGQGSILTVTSYPNRTSVVQRGKWVLENLLGMPPPPPPANVPSLTPRGKDGKPLPVRQQMEVHRANPVCASCHARMDPLGFALENFDGVGRWRNEDAGSPIDASGTLPDGTRFEGPGGLTTLLLTRYRDQFARTFAEKLLTYALGRGLDYYDQPAVRSIARDAARQDYRISAFIMGVVKSVPFQMRKTPEP